MISHTPVQVRNRLVLSLSITCLLVAVGLLLSDSDYRGSGDLHKTLELLGGLLGLVVGFTLILRFYNLGHRLILFIGLAYFLSGGLDFLHGLVTLAVERWSHTFAFNFGGQIPGVDMTSWLLMGVFLLLSLYLLFVFHQPGDPKQETFRFTTASFVFAGTLILLVVLSPWLELEISRYLDSPPVDILAVLIFLTVLGGFIMHYLRTRHILYSWVILSVVFNTAGLFMMFLSKDLFDPFFDTAHVCKVIGYLLPLLGFAEYQVGIAMARVRSEEVLASVEAQKESMLNALPDLVFRMTRDGHFVDFRAGDSADLYVSAGEIVGNSIYDLLPPHVAELCHTCIHRTLETGTVQVIEYSLEIAAQIQDYEARMVKYGPDDVLAIIRNISDRKRAEGMLRKLHRAVEQMSEMVVITDPSGIIEYVNPAFETITGYSADEALGKSPRILKSGRQDQQFYKTMWETIASGRIWKGVLSNQTKSGGLYTEEMTIVPVFDEEMHIINFIAIKRDVTEQKRAEDALRRSRESLARAQQLAHLGNWDWHLQSGELTWSDETYRIFGVEPQSFQPMYDAVIQATHPDEREDVSNAINIAVANKIPYSIMHRICRPDDSVRIVRQQGEVICQDDLPVRVIGTVHDITELVESQERLRQSEERLDLALKGADLGLWDWNIQTGAVVFNERWAQMLGYELTDIEPNVSSWGTLLHPDDTQLTMSALQRHLNGETEYYESEHRLRTKSGHWKWILDRGQVVERDSEGKPLRAAGTHLEIDKRKRAEETLAHTIAQLQGILNASTEVAIIATNTEGLITVFNSGAERILDCRASDVVGKTTPLQFFLGTEIEQRKSELTHKLGIQVSRIGALCEIPRRAGFETREWTLIRNDHKHIPCHVVVTAIKTQEGLLQGYLAVATDIADMKRAVQMLREAKQLAEAATRAKSEFLANMSHEIRTPLNGLVGLAEMLGDTDLTSEQRQVVRTLQESANMLLSIINDILDFSKIEAGKMQIEACLFDVRKLVQSSYTLYSETARMKKLVLRYAVDEAIPEFLTGDPMRIQQVLNNLVSNGLKFTQVGHVDIDVALELETDDTVALKFSVSDTGIGISEDALQYLFQPFSQADSSTTRKYGGTGLGLSISRQLVKLMGGEMTALSQPGKGTTFWFLLNFVKPSETAIAEYMDKPYPDQQLNVRLDALIGKIPALQAIPAGRKEILKEGASVLLAEDNEVNQQVIVYKLNKLGLDTMIVSNGEEVLEAVRHRQFDVILMDCQMPLMDGYETTRRIREMEGELAHTRIIALTAHALQGERDKCLAAGMDDFLAKPVRYAVLRDMLAHWLLHQEHKPQIDAKDSLLSIDEDVWKEFETLAGDGSTNPLHELIKLFLRDTPQRLDALQAAVNAQDGQSIEKIAHALKGSSGNLGAIRLAKMAEFILHIAKTGDMENAMNRFQEMLQEYELVRNRMDLKLQENK